MTKRKTLGDYPDWLFAFRTESCHVPGLNHADALVPYAVELTLIKAVRKRDGRTLLSSDEDADRSWRQMCRLLDREEKRS